MYESFFGLNDLPFRLTPDPRYLFMSAKHREAFAHLLYGVNEGSGFVAVTGEVGAGKTTLIRALLREADEKVVVTYIVNPVLTSTELLQTVNAELGLPSSSTSRKELIEELSAFLHRTAETGGRTVVIVDEAQNLEPVVLEQLRLLSNLETETRKLITIVLIGQPELHDLLARHDLRQLNQRVTVRWHLEKLDRQESIDYIRHRLRIAGAEGELIEPKAIDLIDRYAQGVPRLINIIANRALLAAYTKSRGKVGTKEVAEAAHELGHANGPVSRRERRFPLLPAAAALAIAAVAGVAASFMVAPSGLAPSGPAAVESPTATAEPANPSAAPAASPRAEPIAEPVAEPQAVAVAPEVRPTAEASERRVRKQRSAVGPKGAERLAARLGAAGAVASATEGLSHLLGMWGAEALTVAEREAGTFDVEKLAAGRELRYMAAQMDGDFLRRLDLPALLELELPGAPEVRYVVVERALERAGAMRIHDGRTSLDVTDEVVGEWWNGRAHVLWRDQESLQRDLGPGSGGPLVSTLQTLLAEAGLYRGSPSGLYDDLTENAVRRFQEAQHIRSDGVVGPITQILLYNTLARYRRPTLQGGRQPERSAS